MDLRNQITGTDRTGTERTYKVGYKVLVDTKSNLGIVSDVVRSTFIQTLHLQPYAPNRSGPAVVLTRHSWSMVENIQPA